MQSIVRADVRQAGVAGRIAMTALAHHSLAVAAVAGVTLVSGWSPAVAAGARPLVATVRYQATDEYCADRAAAAGPHAASLLPVVQCRPKADLAAERLAIRSD
jgi:hypothetical protein